jgi:hypothetical protein
MKIRLSDGMIRFRLDRDQVAALAEGSSVRNALPAKDIGVVFQLRPIAGPRPAADLEDGFRIGLPAAWLTDWPVSDVVGFDFDVSASLRVVVEKDFPCAHGDAKPDPPVRMS